MESVLATALPLVIAALLIAYVTRRTGESAPAILEQVTGIADMVETALVFVQSAQQQLKGKSNEEKLDWVMERLQERDEFLFVEVETIRNIVEAAVLRMKGQLPQPQVLPQLDAELE